MNQMPWWEKSQNAPPGSQYGFDTTQSLWGKEDVLNKLLQILGPGAWNDAAFLSSFVGPQFQKNIADQLKMLTPEGARQRAYNQGQGITANMASQGARGASLARAQGFSPAFAQGISENAINQGRTMATQNFAKQTDPMALITQKNQVLQSASQTPTLNSVLGASGYTQNKQEQKSPSILESLLGIAGLGSSFGVNWGKVFHFQ